jgi:hypothetical protein
MSGSSISLLHPPSFWASVTPGSYHALRNFIKLTVIYVFIYFKNKVLNFTFIEYIKKKTCGEVEMKLHANGHFRASVPLLRITTS